MQCAHVWRTCVSFFEFRWKVFFPSFLQRNENVPIRLDLSICSGSMDRVIRRVLVGLGKLLHGFQRSFAAILQGNFMNSLARLS